MPTPGILLFVKAPRPGAAKTRLTPYLDAGSAAAVATCLGRDAVLLARRCLPPNGRLVIAFAPDDGWRDLERTLVIAEPRIPIRQRGRDLGARMTAAVEEAYREQDIAPLVLIGADCPLLPPRAIKRAFDAIAADECDVVLGPAEDGGYYLVALRGPTPGIFGDVSWSTETVWEQTVANARRGELRLETDLPLCYDIDTPLDLLRLRDEMAADPSLEHRAPNTANWLRENALPAFTAFAPGGGERP